MSLYGARDAGQNFELTTTEVLEEGGCEQSAFNPCIYNHEGKQVRFFHHGDDFVTDGPRGGSEWVAQQLGARFIVKDRGVLGPEPQDLKEVSILNRLIRWKDRWTPGGEALECEADPRHVEILLAQLGLESCKPLTTPGVQVRLTPEVEEQLPPEEAREYRSPCVRLGYLALDRPEIQFVAKECARGMAAPTQRHRMMLKRAARFLKGQPRCVWRFGRQRSPGVLDVYSDTDWAGCPISRRSTSAIVCKHGLHCLLTASTTQIPISLSSGEAEFYGVVRAASRGIGLQQLFRSLGLEKDVKIWSDSSAAIGVAQRRGCGKIRHLETPTLWVQKALRENRFSLVKTSGKLNPSDIGTKHLDWNSLAGCLERLHITLTDDPLPSALRSHV